jgi:RNA polymerase sigma-70 factor (ECF subfamily)
VIEASAVLPGPRLRRPAPAADDGLLRLANEGSATDVSRPHPGERLAMLFEAHADRLFRLALRLVGEREEAKDLVQETFLRVARAVERIPTPAEGAEAWLVRTLVNLCRDRGRRLRVRARWRLLRVENPHQPRDDSGAEAARLALHSAISLLTPVRRVAVLLCDLEGYTPAEAGQLLGLRPATVRWHLALARRRLRDALGSTAAGQVSASAREMP